MICFILISLIITVIYYLLKIRYQYWKKRGVSGPRPSPLVGNLGKVFILKAHLGETYTKFYKQYQNEDLVGIYRGTSPVLIVRDPELVKEVTVKSFSHFRDNDIELDKKHDPIFGRNPFVLKGDEWKMVRGQLTPGFTSGKMKWLFPLLEKVCINLVQFIENQPCAINGQGYEAKELSMKFTLNNVASCAFGLQGKCFEEENSAFRQLAREFFSEDSWGIIGFFIMSTYPQICKYIPVKFVTKVVEKKLIKMISDTLKYREENNIVRNDFLHIMAQLKKTCKEYDFTDVDVTAHAAGFFGDGFETSSIVMSFTLFELASHPDAQEKLREEIQKTLDDNNQKLTFEVVNSLQYLEAVVNEALRIHPPLYFLHKRCTKDFTFSRNERKSFTVEKNTSIVLPVYGLQTDSNYYDDPMVYKPERFLDCNKENLTKYTYLPLGEGPRACLGQRFGLLQIKLGIAYIVKNYELSVNTKTRLPLKNEIMSIMTAPAGGLWLDFKKI